MRSKPRSSQSRIQPDAAMGRRRPGRRTAKACDDPYRQALASRLSALLEKRTVEAANEALRALQLSYVLYHTMMIIVEGKDGPVTPGEIARLTGERPNNVTHICNELARRDLITRTYATSDRRRIQIELTPSGRSLIARAQPLVMTKWNERFEGFSPAELELSTMLIRRQLNNIRLKSDRS